jgi:hypothetical protein
LPPFGDVVDLSPRRKGRISRKALDCQFAWLTPRYRHPRGLTRSSKAQVREIITEGAAWMPGSGPGASGGSEAARLVVLRVASANVRGRSVT